MKNLFSSNTHQKSRGFTLAEVLITLGIIGVVAAMTIPILINNYEKTQCLTALKKFYATFQAGIKTYMVNQDCSDLTCTSIFNGQGTGIEPAVTAALASAFKNSKKYPYNDPSLVALYTKYLNYNNEGSFIDFDDSNYATYGIDNFLIKIVDSNAGNCTIGINDASDSKLKGYCAQLHVDVNGIKPPNRFGRDTFLFMLGNDGILYANGGVEAEKLITVNTGSVGEVDRWTSNVINCGTSGSSVIAKNTVQGFLCAARIIEENWQMNY